MFHLSDINKYERCEKLFWLHQHEPIKHSPFVNYNGSMKELCIEYFMLYDPFIGEANDSCEKTMEAMKEKEALLNARFVYENLRIKIGLMLKQEEGWDLYFPYMNCFPKESEAQKIADHCMVLKQLQIPIHKCYVIHLNSQYVREDELDVRKLLCVSDHFFNQKNKQGKSIEECIVPLMRDLSKPLIALRVCNALSEPESIRKKACTKGLKCTYYERCFPEQLSDDSILHFTQSPKKLEMLEQGILTMKEVPLEYLDGSQYQYAQYVSAKKEGMFVDRHALSTWLKQEITYPISYLDFEWETFAIPPYKKMKPFDVLVFQYSLHIEEKGKPLVHKEFLQEKDCREAFLQQLLKDLPKQGSILVYNMEGAEKLRLRQLAQQFPSYEEQLKQVWERMVDLSLPFSTGVIYDLRMKGHYSLKTLVPIFSNYSYEDMDVKNGVEAVQRWRNNSSLSAEEKEKQKQQLLAYCAMDTYAEYIVYHALEKIAKK